MLNRLSTRLRLSGPAGLVVMAVLVALVFLGRSIAAIDSFNATVPINTEVTMGDPDAVVPVTIANDLTSTNPITGITFTVDTAKYSLSSASTPPSGWCVSGAPTAGSISFALRQGTGACASVSNGSEIAPGAGLTFNIKMLPLSAAADVSGDTFTDIAVAGFIHGVLPTWTRRALAVALSATPSSTGVGGVITLSMQMTNRSTVSMSGPASNPAPPAPSSAIVTNTAGPYYGSTSLNGSVGASDTTITTGSTDEFSSIGVIRIDNEDICYTGKTVTSFTGAVRGCNATTATSHTTGAVVYNKTAFTLASGATGTLIWTYSADIAGSVYLYAQAKDITGTVTSVTANSNTVTIGSFTASLVVTPASVTSGQNVTALMTVTNNGAASLIDAAPSALTACPGGAAETLVSGPSPTSISSIPAGGSGIFQWTYQITGTAAQAYCLSGSATATGPVTSNTATSNSGTVSSYSVAISPTTVSSGAAGVAVSWTVSNNGGYDIREVDILTPASGGDWNCGSVAAPANWGGSCASTVAFTSNASAYDITPGTSKTFSITFSSTETVASDKTLSFPVTVIARGGGGATETLSSSLTVTARALSLSHSPAGPIYADGSSRYSITATLTSAGSPVSGKTVTFTSTAGTFESATAVTDSTGQAKVDLISPASTVDTSATVTASYLGTTATDTVDFTGWTKPNIAYWDSLSPTASSCGGKVSFSITVKNTSAVSMTLNSSSYFAFNDSSVGGCSIYKAFLDSSSAGVIPAGTTKTLVFGSTTNAGAGGGVTLPASFIAGSYEPIANSSPPPESGMYLTEVAVSPGTNDQYRSVVDKITLSSGCGTAKLNTLEWTELR
ncbi:MAG: Ig-like domain-containing protein [Deltaproteobacteria bacterium]|nr:Ig-like domain-containing protein [Deltaproteobacteria bacterium]